VSAPATDDRPLRSRALRLRCPWCGEGPLFRGWLRMEPRCSGCGLRYEREAGYFLGSIYLNYGGAIVAGLALHLGMEVIWHAPLSRQVPVIAATILLLALGAFRHARAFWLAFDLACDPPGPEEFAPPRIATAIAEPASDGARR